MESNPTYSMFHLDHSIDTNPLHIVRLPFSYNTKGEAWGDVLLVHTKKMNINILLQEFYKENHGMDMPLPNRKERRKNTKQCKKEATKSICKLALKRKQLTKNVKAKRGYANLLDWRCQLIEYVVERMSNHIGYRNKFLYNYLYNIAYL